MRQCTCHCQRPMRQRGLLHLLYLYHSSAVFNRALDSSTHHTLSNAPQTTAQQNPSRKPSLPPCQPTNLPPSSQCATTPRGAAAGPDRCTGDAFCADDGAIALEGKAIWHVPPACSTPRHNATHTHTHTQSKSRPSSDRGKQTRQTDKATADVLAAVAEWMEHP